MKNETAEIELARTGTFEHLHYWFDHHFFSVEAQVALVERQNEELLIEYSTRFSFCEKAQIRLIELELKNVLLQQLKRHGLTLEAQRILVQKAFSRM